MIILLRKEEIKQERDDKSFIKEKRKSIMSFKKERKKERDAFHQRKKNEK